MFTLCGALFWAPAKGGKTVPDFMGMKDPFLMKNVLPQLFNSPILFNDT